MLQDIPGIYPNIGFIILMSYTNGNKNKKVSVIRGSQKLYGTLTENVSTETTSVPYSHIIAIETENEKYEINIPKGKNRAFVDKVINAFRFNPAWRENFIVFDRPHEKTDVNGKSIDAQLAVFIEALDNAGAVILDSCEGDPHPMGRAPFITFEPDTIPNRLWVVWTVLGWIDIESKVSPPSVHGYNDLQREQFFLILDDWIHNQLDITADRYRFDRTARPLLPDLPEPSAAARKDLERQQKRQVDKVNRLGDKATFDDLVKLTSGRDIYSTWDLERLKAELQDDPALTELAGLIAHESDLKQALRWRLRGLDIAMVLKKVDVTKVLNNKKSENIGNVYEN